MNTSTDHSTPRSYRSFWTASPMERIRMVQAGLRRRMLVELAQDMALPEQQLVQWLCISAEDCGQVNQAEVMLASTAAERVLGLARLVGQIEIIVNESGDPSDFNAPRWTSNWLAQPCFALGCRRPAEFLPLADGRDLLSTLIARMQSGTYS